MGLLYLLFIRFFFVCLFVYLLFIYSSNSLYAPCLKKGGGAWEGPMSKYSRNITLIVDSPAQTVSRIAARGTTVLS